MSVNETIGFRDQSGICGAGASITGHCGGGGWIGTLLVKSVVSESNLIDRLLIAGVIYSFVRAETAVIFHA